jgi:hypothetical protein
MGKINVIWERGEGVAQFILLEGQAPLNNNWSPVLAGSTVFISACSYWDCQFTYLRFLMTYIHAGSALFMWERMGKFVYLGLPV